MNSTNTLTRTFKTYTETLENCGPMTGGLYIRKTIEQPGKEPRVSYCCYKVSQWKNLLNYYG